MIRGLEFKAKKEILTSMSDILKPFIKNGSKFILSDDEVYDYSKENDCGEEIDKAIKNNDLCRLLELPIYIFYMRIARYKDEPDGKIIDNYEDYLGTNCTGIFLIVDGGWFEAYSKDICEIHECYKYYTELGYDCEYKTDEDDGRTVFHVY